MSDPKLTDAIALINKTILNLNVVIFTCSDCDICGKLKSFLKLENIRFYSFDIDDHSLYKLLMRELRKRTGHKAAPYVFINTKFVGDYFSIIKMYHDGSLLNVIENKMGQKFEYDIIVVGGGCGGLAVAKEAAQMGKKVAIFDYVRATPHGEGWKGVGGTGINVGCIPKKLMYYASLIGDFCEDCKYFGWELDFQREHHNWKEMMINIESHVRKLKHEIRKNFASQKIRYFNAYVSKFVNENTINAVDKNQNLHKVSAHTFVIAVGGRPHVPDFPGSEYAITSDELFSLPDKPEKILIIGAGFVGLECAGFLNGLGVEVTVLVRNLVLRKYDSQIAHMIVAHLESLGVQFLHESENVHIYNRGDSTSKAAGHEMKYRVQTHTKHKLSAVDLYFDYILIATGREYTARGMGLAELGVLLNDDGKIFVNKYERTNCPTIFAIGDITESHPEVASLAVKAGIMLARRMVYGSDETVNYDFIPITLFTPLEYGFCGYSEERALKVHGSSKIEIFQNQFHPLEWSLQQRNLNRSFVKLICLKSNKRVIGIHILGPNSAEIIQGFALAIKLNATKTDFDNFIGIYASCAEVMSQLESSDSVSQYSQSTASAISLLT